MGLFDEAVEADRVVRLPNGTDVNASAVDLPPPVTGNSSTGLEADLVASSHDTPYEPPLLNATVSFRTDLRTGRVVTRQVVNPLYCRNYYAAYLSDTATPAGAGGDQIVMFPTLPAAGPVQAAKCCASCCDTLQCVVRESRGGKRRG